MVSRFRFRTVRPATTLYDVVDDNVMHSFSPAMHNTAFTTAHLDAVYVPLRAANFDDFLTFTDALGIANTSVTIPFKKNALRISSNADELTQRVKTTNT